MSLLGDELITSTAKPRGLAGLVHTLWGEGRICGLTVPPRMLALWELSMVPTIAFATSVVWQAAHGSLLWAAAPGGFAFDDAASIRAWYSVIITVVFQGVQFFVGAATLAKMLRRLRSASLLDVFAEYMLLVTTFFGLSFALYICFDEQFLTAYESHSFVNNATVSELTSVPEQLVLFFYYATSTQTFTGFGDISPLSLTAEAFASLQMCCGIIFSVFIISMTLSRFALTAETAAIEAQSEDASEDDFDVAGVGGGSSDGGERSGSSSSSSSSAAGGGWRDDTGAEEVLSPLHHAYQDPSADSASRARHAARRDSDTRGVQPPSAILCDSRRGWVELQLGEPAGRRGRRCRARDFPSPPARRRCDDRNGLPQVCPKHVASDHWLHRSVVLLDADRLRCSLPHRLAARMRQLLVP